MASAGKNVSAEILVLTGAGGVAVIVAVALVARHLGSSTELVRLRNALLLRNNDETYIEWTPEDVPFDFRFERAEPLPLIQNAVNGLGLELCQSDWVRALKIGAHMLSATKPGVPGPIQAGLAETYRRIVQDGQGYCADYVDVFCAMALAAGLEVRTWAFSFDGFGGHGHTFSEVWDRDLHSWRMIDVFNNYYVIGAKGEPLSALDFRRCLIQGEDYQFTLILKHARPGFFIDAKARAYYKKGVDQWYQWWGNNVFSYDRALPVRVVSRVSRLLSQLAAIACGIHPRIQILKTSTNVLPAVYMQRLRQRVIGSLIAAGVGMLLFICSAWLWLQGQLSYLSSVV